jgi:hypothetical protein
MLLLPPSLLSKEQTLPCHHQSVGQGWEGAMGPEKKMQRDQLRH